MSSDNPQPVTDAVPAPESVSPDASQAQPVEIPPAIAETEDKPRVRLNPTADPDAKAVPSLAAAAGSEAESAPSATFVTSGEPVEIPRDQDVQLDANIAQEIEAAMAGSQLPGATPAPSRNPDAPVPVAVTEDQLEVGARLKGTVQSINNDTILVDLGLRSAGVLQTKQFEGKNPEVGSPIEVIVDKINSEEGLILCTLPRASRSVAAWGELAVGQVVDCTVSKSNKGGLEVTVNTLRGFLPAGQIDFGFIANLDAYVGQKLRVKVTEVNPQKRNLVVSRKQFLEVERAERREEMWKTLAVGQTVTGTIKTLKDYGAFVDLGGVDGLLHVGEISWQRINHPSDVLQEGQQIEVQIVGLDKEKNKISLGMKQLKRNPWGEVESRFPVGTIVTGRITRTTDFGAFVELEPGIEGLIHISELEHRRVNRVTDIVTDGQTVTAKVLQLDLPKRRIALSMKALVANPAAEQQKKMEEEQMAQQPPGGNFERKRKGPLRGGTSGKGGSSFFN